MGAGFEVGKRDSEKCHRWRKLLLRKSVWIALLLLRMYQAFLSLGYCRSVESGPTSELSTVEKRMLILPALLLYNVQMVAGS